MQNSESTNNAEAFIELPKFQINKSLPSTKKELQVPLLGQPKAIKRPKNPFAPREEWEEESEETGPSQLSNQIASRYEARPFEILLEKRFDSNVKLIANAGISSVVVATEDNKIFYLNETKGEFELCKTEEIEHINCITISSDRTKLFFGTKSGKIKAYDLKEKKTILNEKVTDLEVVKIAKFWWLDPNDKDKKTKFEIVFALTPKSLEIYKADDFSNMTEACGLGLIITNHTQNIRADEDGIFSILAANSMERKIHIFKENIQTKHAAVPTEPHYVDFYVDQYYQMVQVREGKLCFIKDLVRYSSVEHGDHSLETIIDVEGVYENCILEHNRIISRGKRNNLQEILIASDQADKNRNDLFKMRPPKLTIDIKAEKIIKFFKRRKYVIKNENVVKIVDFRHISEEKLGRHDSAITCVKISSDNRYIASSSVDGSIKIWHKEGHFHTFESVHTAQINYMAFSQDVKTLVSVSHDKSIKLFDLEEKKFLKEISNAHEKEINLIVFSRDGSFFLTSSMKGDIKLWDYETLKEIHWFVDANKTEAVSMAIAPNNAFFIAAFKDLYLKIWDLNKKELLHSTPNASYSPLHLIHISEDCKIYTTISNVGRISTYDLIKEMTIETLQTNLPCYSASYIPEKNIAVLTGLKDIFVLDSKTGKISYTFHDCVDEIIPSIASSPSCDYFVTGAKDQGVSKFKFERPIIYKDYKAHKNEIRGLAISHDEKYVISGSKDGFVKIWDFESQTVIWEEGNNKSPNTIITGHSKPYFAMSTLQGGIKVWDYEKKTVLFTALKDWMVFCIGFTEDDEYLICGGKGGRITILKMKERFQDNILNAHDDSTRHLTTYEGWIISSGYNDIKIWNRDTRALIVAFENAHKDTISDLAVSKKHRLLISCSADRNIKVWSLETWHIIHDFIDAHESFINTVCVSNDGNYIVSGADDLSIKIWSVREMALLHNFERMHEDMVFTAFLTSNNKYLLSSSKDGIVKFTELNIPEVSVYLPNIKSLALSLKPTFEANFDMIIFPHAWNILHYYAIVSPKLLFNVPKNYKIPTFLDAYDKTPLHYIHEEVEETYERIFNHVFLIMLDYLERAEKNDAYNFQRTMRSLGPMILHLFKVVYSSSLKRFLKLCYGEVQPYFGQILDNYIGNHFGHPILSDFPVLRKEELNRLYTKGNNKIVFKTTNLPIDFDIHSDMIYSFLQFLEKENRRYFIESEFVTAVINSLWDASKPVQLINLIFFSILMLSLTISASSIGSDGQSFWEVVTLLLSMVSLLYELYQIRVFGVIYYFAELWNIANITSIIAMLALFGCCYSGYLDASTDDAATWLYLVCIVMGYFSWILHLRIVDSTRNLIRTIISIFIDMKSFLIILSFIIVGFCATLMAFNWEGNDFMQNLYTSYFMLFAPISGDLTIPQQIMSVLYPFILNVVFLNMLINIMGDSFDDIHEKRLYTDNKERIGLINEVCTLVRHMSGSSKPNPKYLLKAVNEDDLEKVEVDERLEELKKDMQKLERKVSNIHKDMERRFDELKDIIKESLNSRSGAVLQECNE